MKWVYSIRNKRKLSLLLLAVVGVVLLNHFQERSNADKMRTAMAAIYQDRLLVEGYIYDISLNLSEMRAALQEEKPKQQHPALAKNLEQINRLTGLFQETELTTAEEQHLRHLVGTVEKIGSLLTEDVSKLKMEAQLATAMDELQKLSSIQLEEGEQILSQSEKIFHSGERFAQLEIVALILILVLVQTLIFSADVFNRKTGIPYHLN
ncbi:MCP four helix bundle domain-containing protein [Cyclobacterium roseum]|uniref:MCP four helix bundle domain-containing protein n=1 Tax=Cyclobacterium roseum TaxID=2666137 RepID=UPI001390E9A1|nr:MCP four helix bundle domain-containing protein [Cyclobacterium roseum]